jgi:glycosidase
MNLLSTHDTERILTVLGGPADDGSRSNAELRDLRLTQAERKTAIGRLRMAAAIQYTVFGVPSVFYGDEAGLEGYHDPFCRRPFPWGNENGELLAFYRKLGRIRQENPVLAEGDFAILRQEPHAVVYERRNTLGHLIVAANRGTEPLRVSLPAPATELLSGKRCGKNATVGADEIKIWRMRYV